MFHGLITNPQWQTSTESVSTTMVGSGGMHTSTWRLSWLLEEPSGQSSHLASGVHLLLMSTVESPMESWSLMNQRKFHSGKNGVFCCVCCSTIQCSVGWTSWWNSTAKWTMATPLEAKPKKFLNHTDNCDCHFPFLFRPRSASPRIATLTVLC